MFALIIRCCQLIKEPVLIPHVTPISILTQMERVALALITRFLVEVDKEVLLVLMQSVLLPKSSLQLELALIQLTQLEMVNAGHLQMLNSMQQVV